VREMVRKPGESSGGFGELLHSGCGELQSILSHQT